MKTWSICFHLYYSVETLCNFKCTSESLHDLRLNKTTFDILVSRKEVVK